MAGHIDLSQSAIGALGGMVMAMAIFRLALPWWVAILLCLVVCAIFGGINAFMVTKLRFPSFIATLAMASMAKGIMYLFSSLGGSNGLAQNINFTDPVINFLGNSKIGFGTIQINVSVFIMIAFFIVFGILMSKTRFGRQIYAVGGNPTAAHLSGINVKTVKMIAFMLSGLLASIAGMIHSAQIFQGGPNEGMSYEMYAVAAVAIGGTSMAGGKGTMFGTLVGALIFGMLDNIMGLKGLNSNVQLVAKGFLIILSVFLQAVKKED